MSNRSAVRNCVEAAAAIVTVVMAAIAWLLVMVRSSLPALIPAVLLLACVSPSPLPVPYLHLYLYTSIAALI